MNIQVKSAIGILNVILSPNDIQTIKEAAALVKTNGKIERIILKHIGKMECDTPIYLERCVVWEDGFHFQVLTQNNVMVETTFTSLDLFEVKQPYWDLEEISMGC